GLSLWSWSLKQKLAELTRSMTAESAEGLRALAALQRRRLWLPTASMFVLLCLIVWIAEIWELPRVFYGGVDTAINWQEALFETAIIALVGILTISNLIRDINERREIELALQESERKYRSYIDDAPDGIFVVDAAGHYLEVNPKACAMAGYTEAELLTMSLTDLFWPDMLEAGRQHFARANETGKVGGEFPIKTKDGKKLYILVEIVALSKDRYLGFSKDITERREADTRLHQQAMQLAMLNEMGSKIAAVLDLDHLLQRAAALIQTSFDYPYVAIVELDPQHGDWVIRARYQAGEKLPSFERRLQIDKGLVGWAATHNEIVLVNDVTADPRYITLYDKAVPTRSELCVPLCVSKEIVGVLDIQSPEQDAFHENDLLVMRTLADQIAVAMQNARLYKKLQEELTERQQTQAALQENERALQNYAERLRVLHAIDGAILAAASPQEIANAALRHIQALIPCWGASIVTLDNETRKATVFAAYIEGQAQPVSHRTFSLQGLPDIETLKSGQVVVQNDVAAADTPQQVADHLEMLGIRSHLIAPLIAHGSLTGVLILGAKTPGAFTTDHMDIIHEIADQVAVVFRQARLHLELEIERQRLKTLMDHLPQGILLLDAEKRILLANPAASACLPYLSQNVSGGPLTSLAGHPIEDLVMAPGEKSYYELTIPSAPCKIVEVAAQPIGTEGWTLVIQDVTEEREVQRRVQQQERLASVGQMAGGIAHDFNNFLTTIMLYAQLPLRKAALPPDLTKAFETILGESKKAAELVQQILDFSRRSPIAMAPMDLKPFIKEAIKLLNRTLPENIEVTVEAEAENCIINGDPTRIQQIIMNLTLNARDAMPDGGKIHIAL
ncbi:MAG: GAF domain-containing protein, partial [Anaerolineae bacterium]|nr:GAF domain-containing protein [Anaerolineae bacterium]